MGCDIHGFVEVKIDGKWYAYNQLGYGRYYSLFTLMAGVRNDGVTKPISRPRGLPSDISLIAKMELDSDGSDGHSHSWLSSNELKKVHEWLTMNNICPNDYFGYIFGNDCFDAIGQEGIEDVRCVFWFDN